MTIFGSSYITSHSRKALSKSNSIFRQLPAPKVERFRSARSYTYQSFANCHLNAFLCNNFLCAKYEAITDVQPLGSLTVYNNVMKRQNPEGQTEDTVFKSEEERLVAMRQDFGIQNIPDDGLEIIKSSAMAFTRRRR